MIAALYVQKNGAYFNLPGVDPWAEDRDARTYPGPHPVVAHPPCQRWCQLAYAIQGRYGHRVGDDGGCFAAGLGAVRTWGGVLEHPAFSHAWPAFALTRPVRGCWSPTSCGGWVCEVSQATYGHRARKLTWLLYYGPGRPSDLDWSRPQATAKVSYMNNHGGRNLPSLGKKEASATPQAFKDVLLSLARSAAR